MNHISRAVRMFNDVPINEQYIYDAQLVIRYMVGETEWTTFATHDFTFVDGKIRYYTPYITNGPIIKDKHFVETPLDKSKLFAAIKKNIVGMTELKKVWIYLDWDEREPFIIYEKTE